MTKADFFLQLAEEKKRRDGKEISLLVKPDLRIVGVGTHSGAATATYDTAIVNVLSNCAGSDPEDCLCVTTYAPTYMCKGMKETLRVKSAFVQTGVPTPRQGKWAEVIEDDEQNVARAQLPAVSLFDKRYTDERLKEVFTRIPTDTGPSYKGCKWADALYMNTVMAMLGTTWNPNKGHDSSPESGDKFGGNNVAALLLEKDRIVAWGLNVMAQNKTFHAETIMLSSYLAAKNVNKLPADTKIVTSLRPCHMCGGFIYHVRDDSTEVVYGMSDGKLNTVLSDNGLEEHLNLLVQAPVLKSKGEGRNQSVEPPRIQDLRPNIAGPSTAVLVDTDAYKLGNAFQQFPQWLIETRKKLANKGNDNDDKKAVNHALGLLKQVAVSGMMTSYGIDLIETFFSQT